MPTSLDLEGLGTAAQLAKKLGNDPQTVTGVGTGQNGGATIIDACVELVTAGGATAATIVSSWPVGSPIYVYNSTATSGVVFVPTGHYLNGSQNGSLTIATTLSTIFFQYKKNYWWAPAAA